MNLNNDVAETNTTDYRDTRESYRDLSAKYNKIQFVNKMEAAASFCVRGGGDINDGVKSIGNKAAINRLSTIDGTHQCNNKKNVDYLL